MSLQFTKEEDKGIWCLLDIHMILYPYLPLLEEEEGGHILQGYVDRLIWIV